MKKAIIITAVVLAAAIVSTVCFGAAFGYRELDKYRDGGLEEFFDNVENAITYDDLDDIREIETPDNLRETSGMDLSSVMQGKDTLKIHADAAEVEITKSTDGTVSADMDIYSSSSKYNKDKYNLTSTSEYDIYLECNSEIKANCVGTLRVAVPDSIKNIIIDVDAGEVDIKGLTLGYAEVNISAGDAEIKNLTADDIKVTVNAGSFDAENCNVKNAEIDINMGDAELSDSFVYTESLSIDVNTGNAEISLPQYSQAFSFSYDISMGNLEIDDEYRSYGIGSSSSGAVSQNGTFGRNPQSVPDEEVIKIEVTVSMGNIKLD